MRMKATWAALALASAVIASAAMAKTKSIPVAPPAQKTLAEIMAIAPEEAYLTPTGPWQIDFADDGCHLKRDFANGDRKVMVGLSQRGVTGSGTILIVAADLETKDDASANLDIYLLPQAETKRAFGFVGKLADKRNYLRWDSWGDTLFADLRNDQRIVIARKDAKPIGMKWPGAADAAKVLKQCHDDFIVSLGIDLAALRAQQAGPKPVNNPASWFGPDDYPTNVMERGGIGNVPFELTVDAKGKVTACKVLVTSSWDKLDQVVCQSATQRARFTPAVGADGKPTTGYFANNVRFHVGY